MDDTSVTLPAGSTFGLNAVAGHVAIGQLTSAAGNAVAELDLATGRTDQIAALAPDAGGVGAAAFDAPWTVWEQLDSATNLSDWSVRAWNQDTGATVVLATSRLSGGGFVVGQQPLPVIRHGVTAWAQPVPSTDGYAQAQLRVADLANGHVRTLDTGRISSPIYAGRYLIWGTMSDTGTYALRAVDADTLQPLMLPDQIAHPSSIGYLAGSPQYLAWSSQDYSELTVWQFASRQRRTFTQDGGHPFQFLQLAGHYALWYGGNASSVLDLSTGKGFDIPGTVTGSTGWIAIAEPVTQVGVNRTTAESRVSRIATPSAPTIVHCP